MDDNSADRGGVPPEEIVRRRRNRKLSGVVAQAVGELAFAMFVALEAPGDLREVLKSELLKWRARYLPR